MPRKSVRTPDAPVPVLDEAGNQMPDRAVAIIGAALDMFSQHGYHGIGMDDIGAVVGVSGPAIYRHFPGKEALLAAALEYQGQRVFAETQRIIAASNSPRMALNRLIRNFARTAVTDRGRLLVTYFQEERNVPPAAKARLVEIQQRFVDEVAGVLAELRDDLSPAELRVRIEGTLGLINSSRFFLTRMDTETLIDNLVAMSMRILL